MIDQHVAIFGDLPLVAQAAMAGNNERAAFLIVLVDGLIQNIVQRRDFALQAAAVLEVDERIRVVVKISPVTITSERRKCTMLSPSVIAFGS